ncbi:MAG: tRNA adenosine(34) deaminase TadA [Simkaniaceae bacterium]|nr:tRNA adenosine(34) deaminase TadA [Simkaniaceae bacterium]
MKEDENWMKKALKLAQEAYRRGEVPVGAVIILDGEVIGQGSNRVEELQDATAHAELEAIRMATKKIKNWRLLGATLYTTLEPCAMCMGGIFLSRLKRIVWGAPDLRHGSCGSWVNLLEKDHPMHTLEFEKGVLADESATLMKQFFKERRNGSL